MSELLAWWFSLDGVGRNLDESRINNRGTFVAPADTQNLIRPAGSVLPTLTAVVAVIPLTFRWGYWKNLQYDRLTGANCFVRTSKLSEERTFYSLGWPNQACNAAEPDGTLTPGQRGRGRPARRAASWGDIPARP